MDELDRTHTSSRLISASSARIYRACIQPEELMRWIAPKGAALTSKAASVRSGHLTRPCAPSSRPIVFRGGSPDHDVFVTRKSR